MSQAPQGSGSAVVPVPSQARHWYCEPSSLKIIPQGADQALSAEKAGASSWCHRKNTLFCIPPVCSLYRETVNPPHASWWTAATGGLGGVVLRADNSPGGMAEPGRRGERPGSGQWSVVWRGAGPYRCGVADGQHQGGRGGHQGSARGGCGGGQRGGHDPPGAPCHPQRPGTRGGGGSGRRGRSGSTGGRPSSG